MPVKRAQVTAETFDNPSAVNKLVSGTPSSTATQPGAVEQAEAAREKRIHKPTSFYLDDETLRKLDRLAFQYNEEKGTRVNRNHIVRYLTAGVELGDLLRADLKAF